METNLLPTDKVMFRASTSNAMNCNGHSKGCLKMAVTALLRSLEKKPTILPVAVLRKTLNGIRSPSRPTGGVPSNLLVIMPHSR